jgi:hypothetical protein
MIQPLLTFYFLGYFFAFYAYGITRTGKEWGSGWSPNASLGGGIAFIVLWPIWLIRAIIRGAIWLVRTFIRGTIDVWKGK